LNVKKSILHVPLYPFLIALAPVISLYLLNTLELNAFDLIRPVFASLVIALAAVSFSRLVSKSSHAAAILGSILIVSALTYEFAFRSVHMQFEPESLDRFFMPLWLAITGVTYFILARSLERIKNSLNLVTLVLNSFGIALIVLPLLPAMFDKFASHPATGGLGDNGAGESFLNNEWKPVHDNQRESNKYPDVYYIVLDGYARGDVLQSRFSFDNSDFTDWLKMKGFFVGDLSHSNYPWTHLSLSATLNGEYLQTLLPTEELESHAPAEKRKRTQFFVSALGQNFVRNSRVRNFFSAAGFRIVTNNSGYAVTRKWSSSPSEALLGEINEFEQALIGSTIFKPLISKSLDEKPYWLNQFDRVVHDLEQFGSSVDQAGSKFVFYHVLSPHPPYCFNEDGSMNRSHPVYETSDWVEDKVVLPSYRDFVMDNYPDNVAGLNLYLKKAISDILDGSDGNAVMIVQSDHGSGLGLYPHSVINTDIMERFGILNAIFIPDGFPKNGLEDTISAVNTFRAVLTNVFDLDLPPLENRAFYSSGDLDFEEVTHRLQDSPPPVHSPDPP